MDAYEFLLAVFLHANQHQNTRASFIEPDIKINPIGPDIYVSASLEISLQPAFIFLLPNFLHAGDVCRRKTNRIFPKKRGERFREIIRRDPSKIEFRNQALEAFCFSFVLWEHGA